MNSFIRIWEQKLSGKYIVYKPDEVFYHDSMQVNGYVHFTSPIRRMIDVINHMYWVSASIEFSNTAKTFLDKFQKNITEINDTMNRIKKVQNECSILCQVMNEPDILNKSYEALVLEQLSDRIYSVYIQELKWIAKVYSDTYLDKYSSVSCTIYIFSKEEQLRKKIRVNLIS
jgi:exoribonuclease R